MAVQLPTPGEEPWGDELNTAINGIDARVSALELNGGGSGGGSSVSRYVPVFVFNGESNSGGLGENSKATAYEIGPRQSVQIFDNTGLATFQTLDIGVNNLVGHDEFAPQEQANRHGWELGLANSVEAGQWFDSTIYLIKTGQGGSTIAEWNAGGAYWQTFLARVRPALSILRSQGKTPCIYVWWTLGINDKGAGTSVATWKSGVQAFFVRLRSELGFVPIFVPTFMVYAGMPDWNTALNEIAAADNMVQIIDSTGAGVISQPDFGSDVHWNYDGMKTLADRLGSATRGFGQHESYASRRVDMLAGGGVITPPVSLPGLVRSPATLTFAEGSAGGTFTVALDKAPSANVTVTVAVSGGNINTDKASLLFTTANWASTQTVTITSPNDGTQSGNRSGTVTLSSVGVSGPATVTVTVTDAYVAGAPSNTALPAITGSTALAGVLTCSTGTWSGSPTGYTYQWKRDGATIAGEVATTHTVVTADQSHTLTCTVTATNPTGSTPATSAGTAIPAGAVAPANTVLPAITGTATVGNTLTCSQGTWSGSPTSYAYQWKRDGTQLGGKTTSTYVVDVNDKDTTLTCTVTATNPQGSTPATSAGVLIPGDPWAALPPVTWTNLQNTTTPTQGTLVWNSTIPGGGLVATAVDVTQAFDIELEYATAQDAAIMTLDDENSAYYDWSSQTFLFCAYPYQNGMYVGTTMGNPAAIPGVTMTYPCHFKLTKSGNDVVIRYGAGTNPYGSVVHTLTGVLTGKTTAYIKGMYLGPGTTLKVNKA